PLEGREVDGRASGCEPKKRHDQGRNCLEPHSPSARRGDFHFAPPGSFASLKPTLSSRSVLGARARCATAASSAEARRKEPPRIGARSTSGFWPSIEEG